jgi:hypothetical protein
LICGNKPSQEAEQAIGANSTSAGIGPGTQGCGDDDSSLEVSGMATAAVVDSWFNEYDNPQKELMLRIRKFILSSDERITEDIKWKTPTFIYKGNLASFNPRSKKHVSLMFHTGAKIPGRFESLQSTGETAAYMSFLDVADFEAKKADLQAIIRSWVGWKSNSK